MAGTLVLDTLQNGAGTASTSADNVIRGCAKAWVNFNGTSTVAIRDSYNVSSITDNGTGNYTVNFTTAMPNANFCGQVTGGDSSTGAGGQTSSVYTESYATTSLQVRTMGVVSGASTSQSARDFNFVNVAIFSN
jgi:hypothetical protein